MNLDLVKKHITPTHVFDIGSNIGSWYRQAKALWPDARFWLIEANRECEPMLNQVVEDVADGDIVDIAVLSDREKEVTFFTMRDYYTAVGASYYRENTPFFDNAVETKRRTTTLDALCWQSDFHLAESLLIKTDAQGADLDILRGGEFMVSKSKAIICEVSHEYKIVRPVPGISDEVLYSTLYNEGATNTNEAVAKFMAEHDFYSAEKLEDICHPIERDRIIQSDMLYLRL